MEKLTLQLGQLDKALTTLDEVLSEKFSVIIRDASIQRFEYCVDLLWKSLKTYLSSHLGVICASPKTCFREALLNKLLSMKETELALQMIDHRNLTTHTYQEGLANIIFETLSQYLLLMQSIRSKIMIKPK